MRWAQRLLLSLTTVPVLASLLLKAGHHGGAVAVEKGASHLRAGARLRPAARQGLRVRGA